MPPRKREESFGQELVIENIQFEDAGKYECLGINEETSTPVRRSFDLKVQCKWHFYKNRKKIRNVFFHHSAIVDL